MLLAPRTIPPFSGAPAGKVLAPLRPTENPVPTLDTNPFPDNLVWQMKANWLLTMLAFLTMTSACSRQKPDSAQVFSFPTTIGIATDYKPPRVVDIQPLRRFFATATWVDATPTWKMPFTFLLRDGRELTVDDVMLIFAIKDVPGYYKIARSEEKAFSAAITVVVAGRRAEDVLSVEK